VPAAGMLTGRLNSRPPGLQLRERDLITERSMRGPISSWPCRQRLRRRQEWSLRASVALGLDKRRQLRTFVSDENGNRLGPLMVM